jgi:hypothetical protein
MQADGTAEPTFRAGEVDLNIFWSKQAIDKKPLSCASYNPEPLDLSTPLGPSYS